MGTVAFFPGAGSFGGEFHQLIDVAEPTSWLVKYPGRFGRGFGVPAESFDAVVDACVAQVTGRAAGRPALVGHSFGAYVAYATAARLQEAGTAVTALVVVGATAPALRGVPEHAIGSPADAAAYLARVDPGALADAPSDEWRDIVAETTVQDMRLLAGFDTATATRLRCPITAVRGDADPLTSDAGIAGWQHCTDRAFTARVFPGGHSDFLRTPACVSWLRALRDETDRWKG